MNKIIDPFTVNLPHLDLHGETTWSSEVLINNFIRDNLVLHKYQIVIIHGKSTGILRNKTKEVLSKNKKVNKYYIDPMNEGETIVELKKE